MKKLYLVICITALILACTGCSQNDKVQAKTINAGCDVDTAMAATEQVLVKMNFIINKFDKNLGIITTHPLSGAQGFELWRSDNAGDFNTAEANLHSIRRAVTVKVTPQDPKVVIECDVQTQRLSMPENDISYSSQIHNAFSNSSSDMQSLHMNKGQRKKAHWIDLGSDIELANRIIAKINQKIHN